MRLCKVSVKGKQEYAEVLGLTDTPTGVKARLRFADDSRDLLPVTQIRMLPVSYTHLTLPTNREV